MPPEVPRDLSKIIARRLHKNPDRRFQHADDSKMFGRTPREQGHDVRFMPAQYFKPYVKTNKSYYIDAGARPGWRTP